MMNLSQEGFLTPPHTQPFNEKKKKKQHTIRSYQLIMGSATKYDSNGEIREVTEHGGSHEVKMDIILNIIGTYMYVHIST